MPLIWLKIQEDNSVYSEGNHDEDREELNEKSYDKSRTY